MCTFFKLFSILHAAVTKFDKIVTLIVFSLSLSLPLFLREGGEGLLLHLKLTVQLLEALYFISYCQIICPFFLCPTQIFSNLCCLSPVPAVHGSFAALFSDQCLCTCDQCNVNLCHSVPFSDSVASPSPPFYQRSNFTSYYSFYAFFLSPLLSCHLWVTEDSCLEGRLMPVFIPHVPFECD